MEESARLALEGMDRAKQQSLQPPNPLLEATAVSQHVAGNLLAATEHYQTLLVRYDSKGLRAKQARVHQWLGFLLIDQGDLDGAEKHLHTVRSIGEQLGVSHPYLVGCLGDLARARGQFNRAEECYALSIRASRRLGRTHRQDEVRLDLGILCLLHGRPEEALVHLRKAQASLRSDEQVRPGTLAYLGAIYAWRGKLERSRALFKEAAAAAPDIIGQTVVTPLTRIVELAAASDRATCAQDMLHLIRPWPTPTNEQHRLALRLLRAHLETVADVGHDWLVAQDGTWIRIPEQPRAPISRRPAQSILGHLAVARRDQRGTFVSAERLCEAAWPDENLSEDTVFNRVRVTIAWLRKRIKDLIETQRTSYRLHPDRHLHVVGEQRLAGQPHPPKL